MKNQACCFWIWKPGLGWKVTLHLPETSNKLSHIAPSVSHPMLSPGWLPLLHQSLDMCGSLRCLQPQVSVNFSFVLHIWLCLSSILITNCQVRDWVGPTSLLVDPDQPSGARLWPTCSTWEVGHHGMSAVPPRLWARTPPAEVTGVQVKLGLSGTIWSFFCFRC